MGLILFFQKMSVLSEEERLPKSFMLAIQRRRDDTNTLSIMAQFVQPYYVVM